MHMHVMHTVPNHDADRPSVPDDRNQSDSVNLHFIFMGSEYNASGASASVDVGYILYLAHDPYVNLKLHMHNASANIFERCIWLF